MGRDRDRDRETPVPCESSESERVEIIFKVPLQDSYYTEDVTFFRPRDGSMSQ